MGPCRKGTGYTASRPRTGPGWVGAHRAKASTGCLPPPLCLPLTTVTHPLAQRAMTGVVNVSALLQRWGRKDGDLLCPEHRPGACESRGDFGCLPDCQEPTATEATHGPDTGMLPTYLSLPPHHLQPFSVRASSGRRLFRGAHPGVRRLSKHRPALPLPRCPRYTGSTLGGRMSAMGT
uniref:Unnamed protein product n=1 Tax=Macaca fascicularis TaxID=9541 RepID=Q9N060_MACFA|nr:unnamed protein product [Macaca fascicularis]